MKSNPRYDHLVSLRADEEKELAVIRKSQITIAAIFRAGMKKCMELKNDFGAIENYIQKNN